MNWKRENKNKRSPPSTILTFTAEGDTWERRENLKNAEELIKEFEQEEVVVRREVEEEREYKRMELPGKYTAKLLYGWDD